MPTTPRLSVRLLAAALLAALFASGATAVLLDRGGVVPPAAAWEAERHGPDCPRLHDHALCGLLQAERWLAVAALPTTGQQIAGAAEPCAPAVPSARVEPGSLPLSRAPPGT